MPLFQDAEKCFAQAVSKLAYCNPFLPQRMEYEREALLNDCVEQSVVWSVRPKFDRERDNVLLLRKRVEELAAEVRKRLVDQKLSASREELALYEDLCLYLVYYHAWPSLFQFIQSIEAGADPEAALDFYDDYAKTFTHYLELPGIKLPNSYSATHIFAISFQIRRAFHYIYTRIAGANLPAAKLRASIWQSVFTHDMQRYIAGLYERMGDFTTLICGPSGTGKEIIASAIGLSRYIPFDPKSKKFAESFTESFHPLNLSALSPTLIESELFGHRKGSFTGAVEDRVGWMESCPTLGTIFLDEIGEVDHTIQVKLLRVIQSRTFNRIGETKPRKFVGKIVAATNRDLGAEMKTGKFREDFYYRLCSDLIVTPSLQAQLQADPNDLRNLLGFICQRILPDETDSLAKECERWIISNLGRDYPWPGNFRELEQCVRNVLIRQSYTPPQPPEITSTDDLKGMMETASLSADDLLKRYIKLVYSKTGNYEETARKLNLDRRTVKAKVHS